MTDLRQGVSEAAHTALDELELLDSATSAPAEIGRAMAAIEQALDIQNANLAAGLCTRAAARLIRAAELLSQAAEVEQAA